MYGYKNFGCSYIGIGLFYSSVPKNTGYNNLVTI